MSSKKITYSSDFKLKVLDYYFKHGGDDIFGLKKKTAGHFNIDKKTINRMLNNPDMVKRARKLITARKAAANVKASSSTSRQPVKSAVKNAKTGGSTSKPAPANRTTSSNQSSACSSTSNTNKASTSSTSSTKSISNGSRQQINNTGGSSSGGSNIRSTPSKSKLGGSEEKNAPGVQIFELPEDPDYSLLKKSINSSSNGVASLAKLLVTGTEEVRNVILNECDVILECKVCRNLFRSVVNFLAHKRIYCQEEFADVRTLFHKGDVQGVTSQSNTIVVEPEPPPDNENFNPLRTTVPSSHTSPLKPGSQSRAKHSAIDSIALKLARKRKAFHSSSSTNVGSSSYYQSLSEVSRSRDKLSRDCSVVLEDIGGVSNAVYQSYIPPGSASKTPMSCIVDEASHSKSGITVAINQNGEIVKTASGDVSSMDVEEPSSSVEARDLTCLLCNTRFATQKTLSVHQRSVHGYERCVYNCPICQTSFSSMWAVVRHLQITHKKNKNQIERLRKVVRKNVRKKMVYPSPGKTDQTSDLEKEGIDSTEEAEEEDGDEEDSNDSSTKTSEVEVPKRGEVSSALQMSSHKNDDTSSRSSPDHRCIKCERKFNTSTALSSHDKFCSLLQMVPPDSSLNPCLRSETPEKKIAIQIRKDYKKPSTPFDINKTSQLMFKVPKTPQEQENQAKIEEMMGEFCNLLSFSCVPCGKRYQSITALKRHAASHMDWTRFECSVCQFRNYHRYEVINHCMIEHKAKGSAAANMVVEEEHIGPLKSFLDNEDGTAASSDVEHEQQEPSFPSTSVVLDKVGDGLGEKCKESEVNKSSQPDSVEAMSVVGCDENKLAEDKGTNKPSHPDSVEPMSIVGCDENKLAEDKDTNKPSHPDSVEPMSIVGCDENKLAEDEGTDTVRKKSSEDFEPSFVSGETLSLQKDEETSTLRETKGSLHLPFSQMDETSDSESPVKCIPSNSGKDLGVLISSHKDDSDSCKKEIKDSFEEDRFRTLYERENKDIVCKEEAKSSILQNVKISSSENKIECLCINKIEKCVCEDSDNNTHVDKINSSSMGETSKSPLKEESIDSVCQEDKKDRSCTKKTETSMHTEAKSACIKTEESNSEDDVKSHLRDADKDIITQDNDKSDEEVKKLKCSLLKGSTSSLKESGETKENICKINSAILSNEPFACSHEGINSDLDEKSSQSTDVPDNHPAAKLQDKAEDQNSNKTENKGNFQLPGNDDDDSVALIDKTSNMESSSVTAATVVDLDSLTECSEQTIGSRSVSAAEISSLEDDEDSACVEDEVISIPNDQDRWMADDEDEDCPRILNDSDTELYDFKTPSLVDVYEDMKCSQSFGTAYLDKEVKPSIPKDDLSLELKDFVGFPSEKDDRAERPHRMRHSVEREDFIYDCKKTLSQKAESGAESSRIFTKDGGGIKQEGVRCSTRRRGLMVKSEIIPKKIKNEEEENSHESCNGSSFQSSSQKTVSNVPSVEASGIQSSSSGLVRKKVRLSRRRLDINLCGEFAVPKDSTVSHTSESETSCASSKLLIKKESPAVTRYSPRLKMAASPVPKKGSKQDFLSSSNTRLLTNGQGQALSVISTAKVKLKGDPQM